GCALRSLDHAVVADLSARLRIERCLVQDQRAFFPLLQRLCRQTTFDDAADRAFGGFCFVAEEFGRADFLTYLEPDRLGRGLAGALPGPPRFFLLVLHRLVETRGVDLDAAYAQRVLRQVERE